METLDKVEKLCVELLEALGIEATIASEINTDDKDRKYISLEIDGDNLGELIGYHGQMMDSIQNVLSLMSREALNEEDMYLVIDINSYRKERIDYIKSVAKKAILNAKENDQEIALSPMKPFERRIVHLTVQEESEMESESAGEGITRYVIIKPN